MLGMRHKTYFYLKTQDLALEKMKNGLSLFTCLHRSFTVLLDQSCIKQCIRCMKKYLFFWQEKLIFSSFCWQSLKCTPKQSWPSFCVLLRKAKRGADSARPEAGLDQEPPSLGFHVQLRGFFWSPSKQNFVYPCLSNNPLELFFKYSIFLD